MGLESDSVHYLCIWNGESERIEVALMLAWHGRKDLNDMLLEKYRKE